MTLRQLKRDQRRWLDYISEHFTARGMTLGRGRPHDRRVIRSLIDAYWIRPITVCLDELQHEYSVKQEEDQHGIALQISKHGTVFGATHCGVPVREFDDDDYAADSEGSCLQNGIDTAWECYPDDGEYSRRREFMQWAVARSTLSMRD